MIDHREQEVRIQKLPPNFQTTRSRLTAAHQSQKTISSTTRQSWSRRRNLLVSSRPSKWTWGLRTPSTGLSPWTQGKHSRWHRTWKAVSLGYWADWSAANVARLSLRLAFWLIRTNFTRHSSYISNYRWQLWLFVRICKISSVLLTLYKRVSFSWFGDGVIRWREIFLEKLGKLKVL